MRRIVMGTVCAAIAIAGLVAASLPSVAQKKGGSTDDKSGSGQIHRSLGF